MSFVKTDHVRTFPGGPKYYERWGPRVEAKPYTSMMGTDGVKIEITNQVFHPDDLIALSKDLNELAAYLLR